MISLQFLYCPQSWKSCPQFRKSEEERQKWPILAAKKVSMSAKSFLFSPNPYCHVLLAKNGAQIGQILLLWPNLYFTSGYRGSPPCTLSHYPDNRETGYSNVLVIGATHSSDSTPSVCGPAEALLKKPAPSLCFYELPKK